MYKWILKLTVVFILGGVLSASAAFLPQFTGTPAITGTALVGNTLNVVDTGTSDADGDTVVVSFQWLADDVAIDGAINPSLTLTSLQAHSDITAEVRADDNNDGPVTFTTAGVLVANSPPLISGIPAVTVTQDSSYSFTPVVSDLDNDTQTFSITNQPAWASFDPATGTLSGIPTNINVGTTNNIVITTTDFSLASDSLPAFNLEVINTNDAPVINSTAITTATENITYSYTFAASDVDSGAVLTYSAPTLPAWLGFDIDTGELTGLPTNAEVGDHAVTLRVSDGTVDVDQSFSISVSNVNDAPVITSVAITSVDEDSAYSYTVTATDVDATDTLIYSAPVLPSWLLFEPVGGVLSGVPSNDEVGVHAVTLRVNDGTVDVDQSFDITVTNTNDAPVINSIAITTAAESSAYSYTFIATDPDIGDVLTYSAPALPLWLDFEPVSGVLSGVPSNAEVGDHAVTLRVNDGTVDIDQSFTITVSNVNDAPVITSLAITSVDEDSAYSYSFTATDADALDSLTYSAPVLPLWLAFNETTAVLSGVPTNAEVGVHAVTLRVNDGTVNVDQSFDITVTNTNDAPVITSTAITTAAESSAYSYTFAASDVDSGAALTYSAPVLPGWLGFVPGTGVLSGLPTNTEVGDHAVTLRVNDGTVNVDQSFTITVSNINDAPVINSAAVTSVAEDSAYSYSFTATDADTLDTLTYSAPVLPLWLSFNATTAVLSGLPTNDEVGVHAVTLRVNDGTVDVDQSFDITVTNTNDAPVITSTAVTTAAESSAYSYTFTATDVDAAEVLTYSAPVLPAWLGFVPGTGVLSGVPSNAEVGDHAVTLRVNDGTVDIDQSFTITVSNVNDAPVISSVAVISVDEDSAYSYTVTATDADATDSLTYSAPTLPDWLSFNISTRELSGVPTNADVGVHAVTLRVNDGTVNVDQIFDISVTNTNDAPTISGTPVTTVEEDRAYSFTPDANDVDTGDTLIFSIANQPIWASFNSATGTLSGTPANINVGSTNNIIITVIDSSSVSVALPAFSIEVINTNDAPVITSSAIILATEEVAYSYSFSADDDDVDDVLTYSAPVLPAWLGFVPGSGVLSGVPTNAEVGDHAVTLRVSDGTVDVDQSFNITVSNINDAPVISSVAITSVDEDSAYSYSFAATDVDATDVLTYSAPVLPLWLDIVAISGVLSGVPTNAEVGIHAVTLRVSDGTVNVDQSFDITVTNTNDAPVINSIAVTIATEDTAYSYTFAATDVDSGAVLTYSAPVRPLWLSFNATTGELSGLPTNAEVGDHAVTLRVNDGTVDVDQSFSINVTNVNDAPVISSVAVTSVDEDSAYSYSFAATDADATDSLTYSAPLLPLWLDFDAGSGVLSGLPTNDEVGDHAVTLRINDGTLDIDQNFMISVANVNDAPTISGIPDTIVSEGNLYSFTPDANDVDAGDGLTFIIVNQPVWTSFDPATGTLSGTPANANVGTTNGIAIGVLDSDMTTVFLPAFNLEVTNTNNLPVITSIAVTTATEDTAYSYTFSATDDDVGDVLTYSATVLPEWLNFNATTGELSGLPGDANVGIHSVTLSASDGVDNTDQSFTVTVANINDVPIITSVAITTATEDLTYVYNFTATDADATDTLTYSAPVLPTWLDFIPSTRVLSGTPGDADIGENLVTLRVNDGSVNTDQSFLITVANINDIPIVTSTPITSVSEGMTYTYTFTASDADVDDVLNYSAIGLPLWLSFDTSTHVLTGVPTNDQIGNHAIRLRIDDGALAVYQDFSINVVNVNDVPVITSVAEISATEDIDYTYTFSATDADATDVLTYSAPLLPLWLSFDTSGVLSGLPTNEAVGDHAITLRVNDGTVDVDQNFIISVTNVNDAPTISGIPGTLVAESIAYSFTPSAADVDVGDVLTFSITNQPLWADFNTATGTLSGTPTNDDVGVTNNIVITVTDNSLESASLVAFNLSVSNTNNPPTISGTPATSVVEDSSYNFTPVANDLDAGDTLVFSISNAPSWAVFDPATGSLSGTPLNSDVGVSNNIVITVTDGSSADDSLAAFNLQVINSNDAPVISSIANTTAAEDIAYSYTLTATDVDVDDVLTYSSLSIPSWLSFNATTGVLTGTPTNSEVGSHLVSLRVSDGTANVDQSFLVVVGNANDVPIITSIAELSATEDTAYSYTFAATDADASDVLTYSAPELPAWLSFNASIRVLSGTPGNAEVGAHAVTLRVSDGLVNVDQSFSIIVANVNDSPVISSIAVTTATEELVYSYTFTATDVDVDDVLTYSTLSIPSWLSFNTTTGVLTGTPTYSEVGNHLVSLRVNDGTVNVDQSFLLVVSNSNDAPVITGSPVTRAVEGLLYNFQPIAEDADTGDSLSFVIVNQPSWASFNISNGTLTGTPTAVNKGTTLGVLIGVNDGTVTTYLSAFNLTVIGDLDGDGEGDDVDLDIDGDGMDNDFETSNGLDPLDPADAALDADNDGANNLDEYLDGSNLFLDDQAPLVTTPADITDPAIVATGLYTFVDFGVATAFDEVDGVLSATTETDYYLQPGSHLVTWSATDAAGNVGTATQIVNVIPLVEFTNDQVAVEGYAVTVKVMLNGPAVNYPVVVPYTVSGTATAGDHELVDGVITISSGTEALLSFNIIDDGAGDADENIVITMGEPDNAVPGSHVSHTIKIAEGNVAPQVILTADQQGSTRIISLENGTVVVDASVTDANLTDQHSYDWSGSDNALAVPPDHDSVSFSFDPLTVAPGLYTFRLIVSDGTETDEAELSLLVMASVPVLTSVDSDGDGVADSDEGYGDVDNDGVPDYLDAISVQNVLQGQTGASSEHLMETESGLSLALGLIAFQSQQGQAVVSSDDIESYSNAAEDQIPNIGGIFDFVVTGLTEAGQSVRVVLPLLVAIPDGASFRKLMPTGWQDFIIDNKNQVFSAPGESAYCPPPGHASYAPGLTEGHWCVQLLLEDGGPNDADLSANQRVVDPGGLAQLYDITVNVKSSGSATYLSLLLILLLWRILFRLRKYET